MRSPFSLLRDWIAPHLLAFLADRHPLVLSLSLVIGIGVAIAAIVFRLSINAVQFLWSGAFSERTLSAVTGLAWPLIVLAPAVGGLAVGLLLQFAVSGRRACGIADVMEARAAARRLPTWRGLSSAFVSAISLGCGASAGREGPVVHLGATIAALANKVFSLPVPATRSIIACAAASAVSASFNAPIAGILFAHEVILGHYALRAFVPVTIASVSGGIVSRLYFGEHAAFVVPLYQVTSYWEFAAFVLLGLVCALVAILFVFTLIIADWTARQITMPLFLRPVLGGLAIGTIAVFFPQILGVGYEATDLALHQRLSLWLMLVLIVVKTLAVAITLASRFGGGIVSPALFIGAMTGGAFGTIAAMVFPDFASSNGLYAIIGMGAVCAAVLGAPLSTAVMVFELTRDYAVTLALMLAVSIAWGGMQAIHGRGFFHWQLETRGLFVQEGPHWVMVRTIKVHDFMEPLSDAERAETAFSITDGGTNGPSGALDEITTLEEALQAFDAAGVSVLPVVRRCQGHIEVCAKVRHVRALAYFNRALIEAETEEHR